MNRSSCCSEGLYPSHPSSDIISLVSPLLNVLCALRCDFGTSQNLIHNPIASGSLQRFNTKFSPLSEVIDPPCHKTMMSVTSYRWLLTTLNLSLHQCYLHVVYIALQGNGWSNPWKGEIIATIISILLAVMHSYS